MKHTLLHGDALERLKEIPSESFDACFCDPPYGISFMGKQWDHGVPSKDVWAEVNRVLKPGAHCLAFGGTRTFHRLTVNIEDAGFEIRDCCMWLYAQGFPKSLNFGCKCEDTEQNTKHAMRSMPEGDIQKAINAESQQRETLFPFVQEQSTQKLWSERAKYVTTGREQSGMEGRSDISQSTRELCTSEVYSLPKRLDGDVEERRIFNGTSVSDGATSEASTSQNRSGSPCRPQSIEQYQDESGVMAGQSKSQTMGTWKVCDRCGKPISFKQYGTALKPAWEPCVVAMKPTEGSFVENALKYGVAGINIDASRIELSETGEDPRLGGKGDWGTEKAAKNVYEGGYVGKRVSSSELGRWPANLILDEESAEMLDEQAGIVSSGKLEQKDYDSFSTLNTFGEYKARSLVCHGDSGGASRFFYCAKVSKEERESGLQGRKKTLGQSNQAKAEIKRGNDLKGNSGLNTVKYVFNDHPTLKPIDLTKYLAKLILPPERDTPRRIIVPFCGTGSEMIGAMNAGWDEAVGIDNDQESLDTAEQRLARWLPSLFVNQELMW